MEKTINAFPTSVTKWAFLTSTKQLKGGTREGYLFFDKSSKSFVRSASFVNIMLHHVQNRKVWLSHGLAADENAHKRQTFSSLDNGGK